MDILQQIDDLPDPVVAEKARKAILVLRRTCALYPLDKIAFSFNGGKDSTVILHLLRAAVAQLQGPEAKGLGGIQSFYFRKSDDFQEVMKFVESSDAQYGLNVSYIAEQDFKRGLTDYLARTGVMAIVLGTRRGDPNAGGQDVFCPSSEGWPPFMRVNPILDWTYHDVWLLLRATRVPYCGLYDQGYTSLGGTGNTLPNSALLRSDGRYEPAYHLADGRLERVGRVHPARGGSGSNSSVNKPAGESAAGGAAAGAAAQRPPPPPAACAAAAAGATAAAAAATDAVLAAALQGTAVHHYHHHQQQQQQQQQQQYQQQQQEAANGINPAGAGADAAGPSAANGQDGQSPVLHAGGEAGATAAQQQGGQAGSCCQAAAQQQSAVAAGGSAAGGGVIGTGSAAAAAAALEERAEPGGDAVDGGGRDAGSTSSSGSGAEAEAGAAAAVAPPAGPVSELTRSAAIVIVGDELLSGKVEDVNARFLCRELRSLGWQVLRVVFVPDTVDEISSAVRALAAVVELVITAGGIGPTLDDVTMQGIALAVGQPLVRLPAMVERLSSYFGASRLTPAHLKMAEGPQHAELIDYALPDSGLPSKFPILRVDNIYVLPGVPSLLVQKWRALKPRLADAAMPPFRNATLRLSIQDETRIAPALDQVAATHGSDVAVGSYPVEQGIIVTLDSKNPGALASAVQQLTGLLPGEQLVALERDVDTLPQ